MKIYDISLPIISGMIVYPGNPGVDISAFHQLPRDSSNLSKIEMGSHTGTHIDTPKHADNDAGGVESFGLDVLIGQCRVLDMTEVKEGVGVVDLERQQIKKGERILVKTKNSLGGFKDWRDDYIYLSGEGADYLADKRIVLFGIDALSVKKRGGKDTRAHTSLLSNKIVIFEGLDLSKVEAGEYTFVGLPLKIDGIDGVPSRVVLIERSNNGLAEKK